MQARAQFIGRTTELRRVTELVAAGSARLITLVGPGGIGKTTLATEVLRRYRHPRRDQVLWVRLARLDAGCGADTVAEEIVRAVAPSDSTGRRARDCLFDAFDSLDARRPILVLDNCEHVLPSVAPLIAEILTRVPRVTVLTTSREPIGWIDEQLIPVPSLTGDHALTLFRRRAELTGNPVPGGAADLAVAARICRHVDNNPLFIRLAAARLRYRPAAEVLSDLTGGDGDGRMEWSSGVRAGDDRRHRSVGDVVAWSYGLCDSDERLLLERLSVFAAGFDPGDDSTGCGGVEYDAVAAVCADHELPESSVGPALQRLVERSLVSIRMSATSVRYFLPESVRVFARSRVRARADATLSYAGLQARHRRYFRDKVVAGQSMWYGPDEVRWIAWIRSSWDDVLLAMETGLGAADEAAVGLEIATVVMALRIQFITGANRAVAGLTERALAVIGDDPAQSRLRIQAKSLVAWLSLWQGSIGHTGRLLDDCVAECLPDPALRRNWREHTATDIGLPVQVEFTRGLELYLIHQDPRAIDVLSRARAKFAAAGDRGGTQRSELFTVLAAASLADPADAELLVRRHRDDAARTDAGFSVSWADIAMLILTTRKGDPVTAVRHGRSQVAAHLDNGDTWTAGWIIHFSTVALAAILLRRLESGEPVGALVTAAREIACLQGGTATLHRSMGIASDRVPLVATGSRAAREAASAVLGQRRYDEAVGRGAQLCPERHELLHYFLGRLFVPDDAVVVTDDPLWRELSPAERDIAILVAAGWTNSAVAIRRGTSVRTVDAQVAAIRRKLHAADRSAVIHRIPGELHDRVRREVRQ